MVGMNLNLGSSVLKREAKSLTQVADKLRADGWERTGSIGDRVLYFEKSGINITAMKGPLGTLIFPSGPIRGKMFGDSGLTLNNTSVIGAGSNSTSVEEQRQEQVRSSPDQLT